jgi:integrase
MRLADVDLEERVITLPQTKAGRVRNVRFDSRTAAALGSYLRRRATHAHAGSGWLWIGHKGHLSGDGIRHTIERRSARAGVTLTPHSLRRGMTRRWLQAGGPQALLEAHNGWRPGSPMVARYVRQDLNSLALEAHEPSVELRVAAVQVPHP